MGPGLGPRGSGASVSICFHGVDSYVIARSVVVKYLFVMLDAITFFVELLLYFQNLKTSIPYCSFEKD